ncbi:hypothetical protein GAMM_200039 [Gammaproteobacteria bacterium]
MSGRPTVYTDDMPKKAYEILAKGGCIEEACTALSIAQDTFYDWKREGSKNYKPLFSEYIKKGMLAGRAWINATIRKAATKKFAGNPTILIYMSKTKNFNSHYQSMIKNGNYLKKLDFITESYNDGVIDLDTYDKLLQCLERGASIVEKVKYEELEKRVDVLGHKIACMKAQDSLCL